MQEMLDDIVKLGMSSAMSWSFLWTPREDQPKKLVCAACGHYGEPVQHQRWGRLACADCGEKLLVPADSPMAAGYWQIRPRCRPLHANPSVQEIERRPS